MTAFEEAVAEHWQQVRTELEPRIREMLVQQPLMEAHFAVCLNVSQNVLKEALVGAMTPALPQMAAFYIELATRLACYVITALPADVQEEAALLVRAGLLPKLADMQSAGNILHGEWE